MKIIGELTKIVTPKEQVYNTNLSGTKDFYLTQLWRMFISE